MSGAAHFVRLEEIRICARPECGGPSLATCAATSAGKCYRCHGDMRPATRAERDEYRAFIVERENPVRAAYHVRPIEIEAEAENVETL